MISSTFRCNSFYIFTFLLLSITDITQYFPDHHHCMATDSSSSSSSSPSGSLGITIERKPSESRLSELNVKCWPKWACSPGKFNLKYDGEETCYLLKGRVKVYSKGSTESVEFAAGDLVTIPKGLSCTWDVSVAVDKYYKFEPPSSSSS